MRKCVYAALKLSGRAKNNYIHLFITSVSNTSNHKKQLAGVVIKKEFDIFERTPPKSSTINFTFLSLLLWFWDDCWTRHKNTLCPGVLLRAITYLTNFGAFIINVRANEAFSPYPLCSFMNFNK